MAPSHHKFFPPTISISFSLLFLLLNIGTGPIPFKSSSISTFVDGTAVQIVDAAQANRMAQKMVDGAVEMVRRKYRLGKGWKGNRGLAATTTMGGGGKGGAAQNAAGNEAGENEGIEGDGEGHREEKKHQHRRHHHHHQHFHSHHSPRIGGGGGANAIGGNGLLPAAVAPNKYPNGKEMERAKARGKQLLEALGVKGEMLLDDENDGEEKGKDSEGDKKREGGNGRRGTPMTMRSLFGKFTRRD